MPASDAVYAYCLVRSSRPPALRRVPDGMSGGDAPRAVRVAGPLWLISGRVPLDTYGPSALEPRLRDLDWVADAAMAHERVVEFFARQRGAVVVPLKLFTMFSSEEKALEDVRGRQAAVLRSMRRIAGCEEWGVRVARASSAGALAHAAPPLSSTDPGAGAAFLAARRVARDAAGALRAELIASADRAYERLARVARAAERRPRRPEPGSNPPVLEAAFLVPIHGRARFKTEARKQALACVAAGGEMTLTGPWPAYNFVGSSDSSR